MKIRYFAQLIMVTLVIIVNAIGCTQVNKYEFTEEEKRY